MEDDARIEALELGLTQLTDAVERLTLRLAGAFPRVDLEPVLEQVEHARRLLGVAESEEQSSAGPEQLDGWLIPETGF